MIEPISPPIITPFPQEKVPSVTTDDAEKGSPDNSNVGIIQLEAIDKWNSMSEDERTAFEKKLVRKLDLRLVPWITLLYLFSFLDRSSIGNAKILGVHLHVSCAD
jgi:hypothetical protein